MHKMKKLLKNAVSNASGVETVVYAIITGMIVVASVTAIAAIGLWVKTQYLDFQMTVPA